MSQNRLKQSDYDDLSAYVDGELHSARHAEVERLVRTDLTWQGEMEEIRRLNEVMAALDVPLAADDLPERIISTVHQRVHAKHWAWAMRLGASIGVAAAAAVVIVAIILTNKTTNVSTTPPLVPVASTTSQITEQNDKQIIETLDFYRDFEILENYETIEAIERLELASLEN